jgi:hypothetical protein
MNYCYGLLAIFCTLVLGNIATAESPPSIELAARVAKRGVKRDYQAGGNGGSFARDETRSMALQIDLQSRGATDEDFHVLWCTVVRDVETNEIFSGDGEVKICELKAGKGMTWKTAESEDYATKERWYYLRERAKTGDAVVGWLVAVYHEGRLVRTHASTTAARRLAANEVYMEKLLGLFLKSGENKAN